MFRLRFTGAAALIGLACTVSVAEAGWHSFWESVERGRQRNNSWPEPFRTHDRHAVRAPNQLMIAKGWERQNLFGEHHFHADHSGLSYAGDQKLRGILQLPPEHRVVYVEQGRTPQETEQRMAAVRQATQGWTEVTGEVPQVVASTMISRGWPASQVDIIGRRFQETMPDPRLKEPQGFMTTQGSGNQ